MVAAPLQTSVGNPIDVSAAAEDAEGDDFAFHWSATGGSIADPSAGATTFTCETEGEGSITVEVSDDDFEFCASGWTIPVTSLRFWALGIPDPSSTATIQFNDEGLPREIVQRDWQVTIDRYRPGGGQPMPRRLTAESGDFRVRLIIDEWAFR